MDNSVTPVLVEMIPSHFDRVIKIEMAAFSTPWTRRDFAVARNRKTVFAEWLWSSASLWAMSWVF